MGHGVIIDRLRIDAFGRLAGLELELAPGLNVLCGPNEAGKSTLLSFLRWMLFGFEKRSVWDRFRPLDGAGIAGELALTTAAGPVLLRRKTNKRLDGELVIRTPKGDPLPPGRLDEVLAGISRELYFQVFAFGLDELASFEALAAEGTVADALFAAGMQGAQRLPEALKRLRDGSEELYTPRSGKTRPLNFALGELEEAQRALAELGDRPARYLELTRRKDALEASLRDSERGCAELRQRLGRLTRLADARDEVLALAAAEAELAALPVLQVLEAFPEDAVARLEHRVEALTRARRERDEAEVERARLEQALRGAQAVPGVAQVEAEARAALERYRSAVELGRRAAAANGELAAQRSRAKAKLASLGLPGAGEELRGIDLSAAAAGRLATLRDQLGLAEVRVSERANALRELVVETERRQDALRQNERERAGLGARDRALELVLDPAKRGQTSSAGAASGSAGVGSAVGPADGVAFGGAAGSVGGAGLGSVSGSVGGAGLGSVSGSVGEAAGSVGRVSGSVGGAAGSVGGAGLGSVSGPRSASRPWIAAEPGSAALGSRPDTVAVLRARLAALARVGPASAERRTAQEALDDRRARREAAQVVREVAPRHPFPAWLALFATAVCASFAVAGFLLAGQRGLLWGAGAAAALAAIVWIIQRRVTAGHRDAAAAFADAAQARARELARLDREIDALVDRTRRAEEELVAAAVQAQLPAECSATDVAALQQELADGLRRAEALERLAQARPELEARLGEAESARALAADALGEAEAVRTGLGRELSAWLSERAFPAGLSPERALELFRDAAGLQQLFASLNEQQALVARELAEAKAAEAAVLDVAGRAGATASEGPAAARELEEGLEALKAARARARDLEAKRPELELRLAQRERALTAAEAELAALLAGVGAGAGAGAEDRLRALAVQAARFRAARAETVRLRAVIEARTGVAPEQARAEAEEAGGWDLVAAGREQTAGALEAVEAKKRAQAEELGAVSLELGGLETSAEASRLRIEEEALKLKIRQLAERYAVDRVALALCDHAKRRYEEQHQPRLVQLASSAFQRLTAGRYTQVRAAAGDQGAQADGGLVAIGADGTEWPADRLSRGTREQLYLAFRIAAVEDLGASRVRLPVIVDDVLVNFDAGRQAAAVDALAELASRHQVLAFSCHPAMAALFVARGARELELPARGALQGDLLRVGA